MDTPAEQTPKKPKPKKAAKKKRKKPAQAGVPEPSVMARNVLMFEDWLGGMTKSAVAAKYDTHVQNVYKIADQNNWDGLKEKALKRMYNSAIQSINGMVYMMTNALKADMQQLIAEAIKEKRTLSKEERDHFRHLLDRLLKESRLDDGKPTDITSENRRVELVLPAGVDYFGVLPPDPRVSIVHAEQVKEDKDAIDINDLDLEKIK